MEKLFEKILDEDEKIEKVMKPLNEKIDAIDDSKF